MGAAAGGGQPPLLATRLTPEPASVGAARRHLRRALAAVDREDLVEDAVLVLSELVTNAVVHAGTSIDLEVTYVAPEVLVTVADGSSRVPQLREYGAQAGTGRGLRLVQTLSDDWGHTATATGKRVWFLISRAHTDDADPVVSSSFPATLTSSAAETAWPAPEVLLVQLRNMPLLLHAAWREQSQSLLREVLLTHLGEPAGVLDAVRRHAEATDAVGLLDESVPRITQGFAPDQLIEPSLEPDVSAAEVTLRVPLDSVDHFATLREVLELARGLAARGRLLTPPPLPEVRGFREWLCGEVHGQSQGRAPRPWVMPATPAVRPVPSPGSATEATNPAWAWVTGSDTGVIAADAEGSIVAASRPALDLLGYDDGATLVGTRLVQIVPERYRQAHLAGMTLYLVTSRQPILGPLLTLPALRRDGTEIIVRLTLRSQDGAGGRPVVIGAIGPARDA